MAAQEPPVFGSWSTRKLPIFKAGAGAILEVADPISRCREFKYQCCSRIDSDIRAIGRGMKSCNARLHKEGIMAPCITYDAYLTRTAFDAFRQRDCTSKLRISYK